MSKKTYADICLERAEKATEGPWRSDGVNVWELMQNNSSCRLLTCYGRTQLEPNESGNNSEFIAAARTDVPTLARRLKRAIEMLRALDTHSIGPIDTTLSEEIDELEALPKE